MPVPAGLFLLLLFFPVIAPATPLADTLMPRPAKVEYQTGQLALPATVTHSLNAAVSPKLGAALQRFVRHIDAFHGTTLQMSATLGRPLLDFKLGRAGADTPQLGTDEAYRLQINANTITISAESVYGAMKALQTLRQLVQRDAEDRLFLPFVNIYDTPRYAWRGMLLDTSRHFMPVAVVKRMLDAMEMVKLNVLHLHLSDDQGFRVESLALPELHGQGSNGEYYSRDDIRMLVNYAADRGIRVVPEFGLPGHSTSWQIGYPYLAATPNPPTKTGVRGGIFSHPVDPSKESTYKLIDTLIQDMALLFPDRFWHIGGDEVNDEAWRNNPAIQSFMAANSIADSAALQAYFTNRYVALLNKHGKTAVGWQEILHPDIPEQTIVHLWTGDDYAPQLQRHRILTSRNYYLDHQLPAWHMYRRDPTDFDLSSGTGANGAGVYERIQGAELANWSESVDGNTVDIRSWPRSAAVAERFWSPAQTVDATGRDDLYRRLDAVSARMHAGGILHLRQTEAALRRLAGDGDIATLTVLASVLEPGGMHFVRGRSALMGIAKNFITGSALQLPAVDQLVEALPAESVKARHFNELVDSYLSGINELAFDIESQLQQWHSNDAKLADTIAQSPVLKNANIALVSAGLKEVAGIGMTAMRMLADGRAPGFIESWRLRGKLDDYDYSVLDLNSTAGMLDFAADMLKPDALNKHNIAIQPGVRRLLEAAINQ